MLVCELSLLYFHEGIFHSGIFWFSPKYRDIFGWMTEPIIEIACSLEAYGLSVNGSTATFKLYKHFCQKLLCLLYSTCNPGPIGSYKPVGNRHFRNLL